MFPISGAQPELLIEALVAEEVVHSVESTYSLADANGTIENPQIVIQEPEALLNSNFDKIWSFL